MPVFSRAIIDSHAAISHFSCHLSPDFHADAIAHFFDFKSAFRHAASSFMPPYHFRHFHAADITPSAIRPGQPPPAAAAAFRHTDTFCRQRRYSLYRRLAFSTPPIITIASSPPPFSAPPRLFAAEPPILRQTFRRYAAPHAEPRRFSFSPPSA